MTASSERQKVVDHLPSETGLHSAEGAEGCRLASSVSHLLAFLSLVSCKVLSDVLASCPLVDDMMFWEHARLPKSIQVGFVDERSLASRAEASGNDADPVDTKARSAVYCASQHLSRGLKSFDTLLVGLIELQLGPRVLGRAHDGILVSTGNKDESDAQLRV